MILVDEAAPATEPMTTIPLELARFDTTLVLVGDHMQLAPTVISKEAEWDGLGVSMLERLSRTAGIGPCMLECQYRTHKSICCWPSREFYEGELFTALSDGPHDPVDGFPWPRGSPLAFVNVQGVECFSETQSVSNRAEASVAEDIVQRLVRAGSVGPCDIGVITPYDAQNNLIKSLLLTGHTTQGGSCQYRRLSGSRA